MKRLIIALLMLSSVCVYGQDFLDKVNFGENGDEISRVIKNCKENPIQVFIPVEATEDEIKSDSVMKIGLWYLVGQSCILDTNDKNILCNSLIHNYHSYEGGMTHYSNKHIPVMGFILTDGKDTVQVMFAFSDMEWTVHYNGYTVYHERFTEKMKIDGMYRWFMLKYFT